MSIQRRCDICDANPPVWMFRKKWKIFRTWIHIEWEFDEEIDMCDNCLTEFKNFVKLKTK